MDLVTRINLLPPKSLPCRLLKFLSRFVWLEKLDFYELDLEGWTQPKAPRMRIKAHFLFGDENDISILCNDPNIDAIHEKENYTQKLRSGDKLLLAKLNDQIIFYLWVVTEKKKLMNKCLMLSEGEIAIERGFTRKEYRGHGLFLYGFFYLVSQRVSLGAEKCFTEIATHNLPMIRTAMRCGFNKINSYYYWLKVPFRHYAFPKGCLVKRIASFTY